MNRNQRNLLIGIGIGVAIVVGLLIVLPSGASIALDVRRSAQRTSPDGLAAWARSLDALERTPRMRFSSWARTPPSAPVQVLLDPLVQVTSQEADLLYDWILEGGVLLYAPADGGDPVFDARSGPRRRPGSGPGSRSASRLDERLGVELGWIADSDPASGVGVHRWTAGVRAEELSADLAGATATIRPRRWTVTNEEGEWTPLLWFELEAETDSAWAAQEAAWGDSIQTLMAWKPLGEGGVLLVGTGAVLSNAALDATPEALVATRAVLEFAASGEAVGFSEYHQGIRGAGSAIGTTLGRLTSGPVGRVVLAVIALATLGLWARGRRFGSPVPVAGAPRRSPVEHVRALAEIYRAAGADRVVADRLVTGAARRAGLDAAIALDPEAALAWWQRHGERRDSARQADRAWSADPPALQDLVDALDTLVPPLIDR